MSRLFRSALSRIRTLTFVSHPPKLCVHTSSVQCSGQLDGKTTDYSRFPVPDIEDLPQDMRDRMTEVEEKSGFMPNVFNAMSYRPDDLRCFMNYYDVVMGDRGNLTKADKEMIIVATSSENGCLYCIIAHGALHRIYSRNPHVADQLAANWKTSDIDGRQYAILDFALDVCHCRPLSEEKFENLYKHGLTKEDAWDIGAVVALFALSNRMAYLTNMKPNKEFYLMGRVKREQKKE
ncbi:uncharacterized protein LOC117344499 [Pecten maximus]|uniref:uncharacterized protein LOC117344499 n=1 Tax=Pecten maximus TaxID=6579 RepID=UPI0014583AB8|nr:uncharacterized protein LOC117344499 [Pecten maximus]